VAVVHGVVGVAVVLLVPWKSMIVRRGLRRARRSRWASLVLAALAVTALLTGLGSASGLLRSVGGFRGIWLHVAAALALVPLVVWHVLARPAHPHRTDLSRRTLLRAGTLGVAAAGVYVAITAVVRAAGLPGASRRFTGSYEAGSFDPAAIDHELDRRRAARGRPGHLAAGRRRRRRRARALAPGALRPPGAPARDPGLHQRLVRRPGLGGRAGRGAGSNTGAARSLHVHSTRRPCSRTRPAGERHGR
jgi:hypothetical protein